MAIWSQSKQQKGQDRSPDYQTSFESVGLSVQEKKFRSEQF